MPRRLNYTKRQRIVREHIHIRLQQSPEGLLTFDADLDLSSYRFNSLSVPARVYVEAYRGATATWKRFYFGTTSDLSPATDRSLDEFRVPHGILFRIRVTSADSTSNGCLLAEADRIRPLLPGETDQSVQPLIQHMPANDLGHELWRVDFSGEMPLLKINDSVSMGVDQFLVDARFRALFAPAVFREVLMRIIVIEQAVDDEEDDTGWHQRWLRFGKLMSGSKAPRYAVPDDLDQVESWINEAVEGFAKRGGMKRAFESGELA